MAAFTASVTGNWNNAATFGGAGIPASGDTVTISNGVTLTVPVGYTAVCGTSPTDDTGAVALQCSSVSTGTGILVVNGTLKWQGPVRMGAADWTVGAGGTLTYDASGAATPASALYTWQTIQNTATGGSSRLLFNGSSGSRCTVNSVSNVQSGGFGNAATNWQGGGQVQATFTDFSYQGPATTSGNFLNSNLNSGAVLTLDDCTIDHCAQIQVTGPFNVSAGIAPDATFRVRRTKITNPANTDYTCQIYVSGATFTTGTRLITNNDIAGLFWLFASDAGGAPTNCNFTFTHNLFRCRDLTTGSMNNNVHLNGCTLATWDQNLVAAISASTVTSQDPATRLGGGTFTNSYCFRMPVPTVNGANMHPIYLDQRHASVALTGWIFQQAVQDTGGDVVNLDKEATSARTVQIKNSIYLTNTAGDAPGSLLNQQGGVNQTQTVITFDHNTVGGGEALPDTATVFGVGCEAGTTWPAGAVASIRSNLPYRLTSGTATLANSSTTSATVASGAVTAADYNWTYNVTGSIYGNPSAQFSGTPGTHDGSGDPQFVDRTRSLLTFDQGYLSAAVGTAWAASTSYAVGDIVSTAVSAWYGNQTQNWRCVTAHTSGTNDKPASGQNFTANWEPAALKSISDSLIAGTTYSGGANSLVGELVSWTKAGFAPQNAALRNAGHDSVTIGAVEVAAVATADYPAGPIQIPNRRVGPMALRLGRHSPTPFDVSVLAPVTADFFGARVQLPNNRVGPMALRRAWHSPVPFDMTLAPQTFNDFAPLARVPNNRVGPMAMRALYRPLAYPFDSSAAAPSTANRLRRLICSGA